MVRRWHVLQDGAVVTLARHLPVRFDVSGKTTLPSGRPLRFAHQIRQDMWRALRDVRGFSPVVRLEPDGAGWGVTAGGRVVGVIDACVSERISELLEDATLRARWVRHAGERR